MNYMRETKWILWIDFHDKWQNTEKSTCSIATSYFKLYSEGIFIIILFCRLIVIHREASWKPRRTLGRFYWAHIQKSLLINRSAEEGVLIGKMMKGKVFQQHLKTNLS